MRIPIITAIVALLLPHALHAQKIGVLPFEDASGIGQGFGQTVAKFIRSEFLKDKRYTPKFIPGSKPNAESDAVDLDEAIELGKKSNVEYVVIGTILEAEVNSSSSGLGGVRVFGQNVGSSLRTVSASVILQGDLVSVKDGTVLESFRVEGKDTDASVGADVSTDWGRLDADAKAENTAPHAKALREAVANLAEEITDFLTSK